MEGHAESCRFDVMQIESQEPPHVEAFADHWTRPATGISEPCGSVLPLGYWDQAAEDPIVKLELNYGKACTSNGRYSIDFDGPSKKLRVRTMRFLKVFPMCSFDCEEGAVMGLGGSGPEKLVDA